MPKLKHHFVPKFYLRLFASNPNRIHLYNFSRHTSICDVSLRDQCYKHRFYGETDEMENTLAVFESHTAPILRQIANNSNLPRNDSPERVLLLFFIALQLLRTSLAVERLDLMVDKLIKQIMRHDAEAKDIDPVSVRFGLTNPAIASLSNAPLATAAISDLQMHLICTSNDQVFITSDNPVFRYNQYFESFRDSAMTGSLCRGLQLFFPLSPKHLLMLYDSTIYKVTSRRSNVTHRVSDSDINTLNFLQTISADQNLYFHDWNKSNYVVHLSDKAKKYREPDVVRMEELEEVGNDKRLLLHMYEQTPNLRLNLSFVSLQKRARQKSMDERLDPKFRYRKQMPELQEMYRSSAPPGGGTRWFQRRSES